MKIPQKLKIGGITFKVKLASHWPDRKEHTYGETDYITHTIFIDEGISEQYQAIALFHEILHCLNITMNHVFLDSLSHQLYQVFSDNKLLR